MRLAALIFATTFFFSGVTFYAVKADATGASGGVVWLLAVAALIVLLAVVAADSERRSRQ